ncbi:hypothetical protein C1752_00127 [Acaryochloris thomasi RCC1774]|uniref:Glutathione S-transferase n=1 Tax=Acaryochloris thomasi RCC1774 TaxID=1764569 RepID=A0A2W1JQ36_9CYAN|nr:MAPEG family protein [Acaryochloris thomasi]PZD75366.1 hypothetical protein C1752_00127 [Acaryochloris thomasi RCC1774]
MSVPISALFVGLNGLIAFVLSCIVVAERTKTRIWHGEIEEDIKTQKNYLATPNRWAAFIERCTRQFVGTKLADDGLLQRKVRAYGNFTEYIPLGLLLIIILELMSTPSWPLWLMGGALTIGRIAHAWGLIKTYGPSPGRAIGFGLTWLVYIVGVSACIYCGMAELL